MRSLVVVGAVLFSACGVAELLPPSQDGGLVTVPGSFHSARFTPGHKAHLDLKGEKKVACHDCHAIADAGFVSPGVELCANCHKDQIRQHHPLDGGTEPISCLTCHAFNSKDVGVRFDKWGCMSCHKDAQGQKKPITVHLEGCANCHKPHDAPFTQPTDCTLCHQFNLSHGPKGPTLTSFTSAMPDAGVAETCLNCHKPHTRAVAATQQCLECHSTEKEKVPLAARVSPQALAPDKHAGCGSCHPTHQFDRQNAKPCLSCHKDRPVLAWVEHKQKCTTCHQQHAPHQAPKPCESCHKEIAAKNQHPKSADGKTCMGCHPPHPESFDAPNVKPCLSCHDKPAFKNDVVHAATTNCDACHKPHTGKPKFETLCVQCHKEQVALLAKTPKHAAKCTECHAGLPHGEPVAPKPCLECHKDKTPPQKGHKLCSSCHESHSAKVLTTCATCHLKPESPALPGLHAVQKHRDCKTCHAPHEPQPGFGPKSCLSCHQRPSQKNHPTPPTQCIGCHLFK